MYAGIGCISVEYVCNIAGYGMLIPKMRGVSLQLQLAEMQVWLLQPARLDPSTLADPRTDDLSFAVAANHDDFSERRHSWMTKTLRLKS
jgi:hypothetical protein